MTVQNLRARNQRIYLTGFMGSGKSTIGPPLAGSVSTGEPITLLRLHDEVGRLGVPILDPLARVVGAYPVDIDSDRPDDFSEVDAHALGRICALLEPLFE